MRTTAPRFDETDRWVFAVPPLARTADGGLDRAANGRMIGHIEAGGLTMMMYGGNANFYHLAGRDYAATLELLAQLAGKESWMIPSAGPHFGKLMEAAPVLRDLRFPSAMMLPAAPPTPAGGWGRSPACTASWENAASPRWGRCSRCSPICRKRPLRTRCARRASSSPSSGTSPAAEPPRSQGSASTSRALRLRSG